MRTSDFDYELPPDLIAQQPPPRRTDARMLVLSRADGSLRHRGIVDLGDFLDPGDLLVLNNTRVFPARLTGRKDATGGAVEVLLVEEREPGSWEALCRMSGRPTPGLNLTLARGRLRAQITEVLPGGRIVLRFSPGDSLLQRIEEEGRVPLPPYIRRDPSEADGDDAPARADRERYQTVYAAQPGAIAAPTAGLHFTRELLDGLRRRGIGTAELTLHVGPGTFRPVKTDEVADHRMDPERYSIPEQTAAAIRAARSAGRRIVAVGTTTVRALESVACERGEVVAAEGRTSLFIRPPYPFRVVGALLTNFHLPRSTLLMLVSAFAGTDNVRHAYREAVNARYRFYSYGDCMLIV